MHCLEPPWAVKVMIMSTPSQRKVVPDSSAGSDAHSLRDLGLTRDSGQSGLKEPLTSPIPLSFSHRTDGETEVQGKVMASPESKQIN